MYVYAQISNSVFDLSTYVCKYFMDAMIHVWKMELYLF